MVGITVAKKIGDKKVQISIVNCLKHLMVLITCILTESVKKGLVSPKLAQYYVRRKLQLLKLNGSVLHVV